MIKKTGVFLTPDELARAKELRATMDTMPVMKIGSVWANEAAEKTFFDYLNQLAANHRLPPMPNHNGEKINYGLDQSGQLLAWEADATEKHPDPTHPSHYIDHFKAATPGETLLKMLASPALYFHAETYRRTSLEFEIREDEYSKEPWNVHQFEDALQRYQIEQCGEAAAEAYRVALAELQSKHNNVRALGDRLPRLLVRQLDDEARKREDQR